MQSKQILILSSVKMSIIPKETRQSPTYGKSRGAATQGSKRGCPAESVSEHDREAWGKLFSV